MLIREKTANAAKTSAFGTGAFSDARLDPTFLQAYEIKHKTDPSQFSYSQVYISGRLRVV